MSDPSSGFDAALFLAAQEHDWQTARAELAAGRKRSHWIWFVFPQLRGLGSSHMATRYALADVDAAAAYLAHPVLGARYRDAVAIVRQHVHEQAGARAVPLVRLMGADIDALKLVSSLTLFQAACAHSAEAGPLATHIADVLDVAAAQGLPRCAHTTRALSR